MNRRDANANRSGSFSLLASVLLFLLFGIATFNTARLDLDRQEDHGKKRTPIVYMHWISLPAGFEDAYEAQRPEIDIQERIYPEKEFAARIVRLRQDGRLPQLIGVPMSSRTHLGTSGMLLDLSMRRPVLARRSFPSDASGSVQGPVWAVPLPGEPARLQTESRLVGLVPGTGDLELSIAVLEALFDTTGIDVVLPEGDAPMPEGDIPLAEGDAPLIGGNAPLAGGATPLP